MRVRYIDKKFNSSTLDVIEHAVEICERYGDVALTLRQLYYQFVQRNLLPNNQQSYNRLAICDKPPGFVHDFYCYPIELGLPLALKAFERWDGRGDPIDGWVKHYNPGGEERRRPRLKEPPMDITVTLTDDEEDLLRHIAENQPISHVALVETFSTRDGEPHEPARSVEKLVVYGLIQRVGDTTDMELTDVGHNALAGDETPEPSGDTNPEADAS